MNVFKNYVMALMLGFPKAMVLLGGDLNTHLDLDNTSLAVKFKQILCVLGKALEFFDQERKFKEQHGNYAGVCLFKLAFRLRHFILNESTINDLLVNSPLWHDLNLIPFVIFLACKVTACLVLKVQVLPYLEKDHFLCFFKSSPSWYILWNGLAAE